jgi:hypothetical protein
MAVFNYNHTSGGKTAKQSENANQIITYANYAKKLNYLLN